MLRSAGSALVCTSVLAVLAGCAYQDAFDLPDLTPRGTSSGAQVYPGYGPVYGYGYGTGYPGVYQPGYGYGYVDPGTQHRGRIPTATVTRTTRIRATSSCPAPTVIGMAAATSARRNSTTTTTRTNTTTTAMTCPLGPAPVTAVRYRA